LPEVLMTDDAMITINVLAYAYMRNGALVDARYD
jgi:hypothetical protein